jgi:peptidoglycan/LPS O-acetylase OafA/YrhL
LTHPDDRAPRWGSEAGLEQGGASGAGAVPLVRATEYQAHIDGLRAMAVLAVIANHFSKAWLPGGYLGVDVFFVISGFVITASLASRPRLPLGPFLRAFFQRRIKRLLPALLVCVLVTGVAISVLDPQPGASLWTGIHALFGLSNLYLYFQAVDYFAPTAQANAFTQTWSLGVEEQFYLVYPLLFWWATGGRLGAAGRALPLLVGGLSALSFAAFVVLFANDPAAAYFLTPARFWELGAGCLLYAGRQSVSLVWLKQQVSRLGLLPLLGLLACMWAPVEWLVPATAAAVALTCLLLLGPAPGSLCQRVLTWSVLRHIGLISYSLYLWHWTVLVLARWSVGVNSGNALFLLLAMFVLAELSYRWVEKPMRHWQGSHTFKRGIGASLLATAVMAALLFQHTRLLLPLDPTIRQAPAFMPVKGLPYNPTCVVDAELRKLKDNTFELCTEAPRSAGLPTLWAMGDSHAGHLQGMLNRIHRGTGAGIHLIETPSRPYPYAGPTFEPRERILAAVHEHARPGDMVLVSRLFLQPNSEQVMAGLDAWMVSLKALAQELQTRQMHLVVVGPPPMFDFDNITFCLRKLSGPAACNLERAAAVRRVDLVHQLLEQSLAGQANAHVFRSFDVLCPASQEVCSPLHKNWVIYRDRDHLNVAGSTLLAEPFYKFLQARGLMKAAQPAVAPQPAAPPR